MIAILAALRLEITGLVKEMMVEELRQEGNCRLLKGKYRGQEIILTQMGPGKANAERAASLVITEYLPEGMVCVGFAGGLKPELKGGDLILCESFYSLTREKNLTEPQSSDKSLVRLAVETLRREGLGLHRGNSLTVSEEVTTPREKELLRRSIPVDIVDMENYWLAKQAARRRIPFLAVRAISDAVDQPLPEGQALVDVKGDTDRRKVALHLLVHPGSIMAYFRLFANTRRAEANLTAFVAAFVDGLSRAEELNRAASKSTGTNSGNT